MSSSSARTTAEPRLREAWSGDSPLRAAASERLLDASHRCVVRDGVAAVSIASVALEAGVSRPTVYRYFKDRSALVSATLVRGGAELADSLDDHLRGVRGAAEMAIEAQLHVLDSISSNPLLSEAWHASVIDADIVADFTSARSVALARRGLDRLVVEAGWSEREADEAVELMLRILLTLLIAPGKRSDPAALRRFLERRLVPGLGLADVGRCRDDAADDAD
jgi:AcrR family transcriptional regulator